MSTNFYDRWLKNLIFVWHICQRFFIIHFHFRDFWEKKIKIQRRLLGISRLNSGRRNLHNFFLWAIFLFSKNGNESVNHADSGYIKLFVQFPGNSILKISLRFWNCVGCIDMRGRFILKIAQCVSYYAGHFDI